MCKRHCCCCCLKSSLVMAKGMSTMAAPMAVHVMSVGDLALMGCFFRLVHSVRMASARITASMMMF